MVFSRVRGTPPEKKWGITRENLGNPGISWISTIFYNFSGAGICENLSEPHRVFNCTGKGLYPIWFLQYFIRNTWAFSEMLGFIGNACFFMERL